MLKNVPKYVKLVLENFETQMQPYKSMEIREKQKQMFNFLKFKFEFISILNVVSFVTALRILNLFEI